MKSFPSTDLKQKLGDVLAAAGREPVAITRHNKQRFVLMSRETYESRFAGDTRTVHATAEMPAEHLALLEDALREADRGN